MVFSISIVFHPESDNNVLREAFQKLDKWHPLAVRKYFSFEEAQQTLKTIVDPKHSVCLRIGQFFLEKVELPQIPDLIVCWGPTESLPENLPDFLHFALYSTVDEEYFMDIIEILKVNHLKAEPLPFEYSLVKHYDEKRDWMFYQVNRPFDEPPFTTIIKRFSTRGIRPLFGQLFVTKSWGLLKSDHDFLKALWENEFGDTPFDMTKELEQHAHDLQPTADKLPDEMPQVYRSSIKDLFK